MNTALGDVHNLCWKLALVVRGIADPSLLDTYEVERLPVIRFNVEQSVRNARRMEAAGLGGIMKTQEDFREQDIARMREAVPGQREHFEYHGQTFGYAYRSRLIFDEGNDAAPKDINTYSASAAPGGRAPHCWLKFPEGGETISTIDLFKDVRFTLLAGRHAQPWVAAFTRAAANADIRFQALRIGADGDLVDHQGAFHDLYEISSQGAVLVRPDGHVTWRDRGAGANPDHEMARVLAAFTSEQPRWIREPA